MTKMHRRTFLAAAGMTALAHGQAISVPSKSTPLPVQLTGNGEWTYAVVSGWGGLPRGTMFGGTHGAIAQDKAGNIYVSTQSETGVLVYNSDGRLLRKIARAYPEIHSMVFATESGTEYIYATVQKGTPRENWLVLKMKTDGSVVLKITAPPEAGFKTADEWRVTAALPTPEGSIFVANGYGDSRIFRFDSNGNYRASYSEKGGGEGQLNCSHGLALDLRYDQPLLLVCDRENRRLSYFDLDGRYVRTGTQHLRRPCQAAFYGDYAVVSELEGRVTILDRDNVPVAFVGDNPQKAQWANYDVDPRAIQATMFSAAHGCYIDSAANIFVSDWNQTGRVTKLSRLRWS
jgi:hypothetical protein